MMSEFPSGGMYIIPNKTNSFILEGIYFPRIGLWKNAIIRFQVILTKNFPQEIPILKLITSINHPLITEETNIFDFTKAFPQWNESFHLYELLQFFKYCIENMDYVSNLSHPFSNSNSLQQYNNERESFINECKNCVTQTMNEMFNSDNQNEIENFFHFEKELIDDNLHEKILENMKSFNDISLNEFSFSFDRRG